MNVSSSTWRHCVYALPAAATGCPNSTERSAESSLLPSQAARTSNRSPTACMPAPGSCQQPRKPLTRSWAQAGTHGDKAAWERIEDLDDNAVRALRNTGIGLLGALTRRRVDVSLDPDALTVGFARRFATYKRADLLLRRTRSIVCSDRQRRTACPVRVRRQGPPRGH